MKKMILVLAILVLSASTARAHKSSSMEAVYDWSTKTLNIQLDHQTDDRKEHYIKRIVITVNGQKVHQENYNFQQKLPGVDLSLPLEVKEADSVSVKAVCAEGGQDEITIVIEPEKKTVEEK